VNFNYLSDKYAGGKVIKAVCQLSLKVLLVRETSFCFLLLLEMYLNLHLKMQSSPDDILTLYAGGNSTAVLKGLGL